MAWMAAKYNSLKFYDPKLTKTATVAAEFECIQNMCKEGLQSRYEYGMLVNYDDHDVSKPHCHHKHYGTHGISWNISMSR